MHRHHDTPDARRPRGGGPRRERGPRSSEFGWDLGLDLGGGRRRGGRRRRGGGDVRAAALLLLAEQPRHGYDLIQQIQDRSQGRWTPSPGSVYPVLQQLEDEGLVEFERVDGRKTATLTDEGQAHVAAHRDDLGTPWQSDGDEGDRARELAAGLKPFVNAWRQVVQDGTPAQQARASAVVDQARRDLYGILSDDDT